MFSCATFDQIKQDIQAGINKLTTELSNCLSSETPLIELIPKTDELVRYLTEIIYKDIAPAIIKGLQKDEELKKYFKEHVKELISKSNNKNPAIELNNYEIMTSFITEKFVMPYFAENKSLDLKNASSERLTELTRFLTGKEGILEELKNNIRIFQGRTISDSDYSFILETIIEEQFKKHPNIVDMINEFKKLSHKSPFYQEMSELSDRIHKIISTNKNNDEKVNFNGDTKDLAGKHRDVATLFKQFNTLGAYEILKRTRPTSNSIRENLYQQYIKINTIGNDIIRHLSTEEIQQLLAHFREHPQKDISLILIAIAREVLYRISGPESPIWPTHSHMLALLIQLQPNLEQPFCVEIAAESHEHIICALLAVVKSFQSNTVVLLTSSEGNYYASDYETFYKTLHIPLSVFNPTSTETSILNKGVNYAGIQNFAAYNKASSREKSTDRNISYILSSNVIYSSKLTELLMRKIKREDPLVSAFAIGAAFRELIINEHGFHIVFVPERDSVQTRALTNRFIEIQALIELEKIRGNIITNKLDILKPYEVRLTHTRLQLDENTSLEMKYDRFENCFNLTVKTTTTDKLNDISNALYETFHPYGYDTLPLETGVSENCVVIQLDFTQLNVIPHLAKIMVALAQYFFNNKQLNERLNSVIAQAIPYPVPEKNSMINVLNEMHELFGKKPHLSNNSMFNKIWSYLNNHYLNTNRDSIFSYYFLPIVKIIQKFTSEYKDIEPTFFMEAIVNYSSSRSATSVNSSNNIDQPLPFNNLKDLLDNQKTRSKNIDEKELMKICSFFQNTPVIKPDDKKNKFIEECSNLQMSLHTLDNVDYGVEVALQILQVIGQQDCLNGQTDSQLLAAQKKRAIEVVEHFTNKFDKKVNELLKFVELVTAKHSDEFSPYAYIRKEQGTFRYAYGNTTSWGIILDLIKSKLHEFHKQHSLTDEQTELYYKIMTTHRKHTGGFGWFNPRRSSDLALYYEDPQEPNAHSK